MSVVVLSEADRCRCRTLVAGDVAGVDVDSHREKLVADSCELKLPLRDGLRDVMSSRWFRLLV